MKFVLPLFMFSFSIFADESYLSGKKYCENIQKKERGSWTNVPQDYKESEGKKTPLYHWFLGGKFDPSKPTIIHVDGGPGATSHNYSSWKDELAKENNILFFDQRGYVCSRPSDKQTQEDPKFYSIENSARDIEEIRKKLGLDKVSIYGESFGATISLQYASLFPERVKSVVLEGPAFLIPDIKQFQDKHQEKIKKELNALLKEDIKKCLEDEAYVDLVESFSSSFGLNGILDLSHALNSKYKKEKVILSTEDADKILDQKFSASIQGKYSLNDESYTWEKLNTEIIVDNDLACDQNDCENKRVFDARKLKIDSPVYLFLGEYDGTTVSEVDIARKAFKNSTLIEMMGRGHGPFYEVANKNIKAEIQNNLNIFSLAIKGLAIEEDDISTYNKQSQNKIIKK